MDDVRETAAGGELAEGVLREILRTPLFKDILKNVLSEVDPQAGPPLVRTLILEDPEVVFSVLGAMPEIVNLAIGMFAATGEELSQTFPPRMLKALLAGTASGIDTGAFREGLGHWGGFARGMMGEFPSMEEALTRLASDGINSMASAVNRLYREDPRRLGTILSDVISGIDGPGFSEATTALVNTVLDQRIPLGPWIYGLIKSRLRNRLKRMKSAVLASG